MRGIPALAALVVCGSLLYLCPYGAGSAAMRSMRSSRSVTVFDRADEIELRPAGRKPKDTGVVFYPGARVDSRAYTPLLRPLAEAGYPVFVLKSPLGMAILNSQQADAVVSRPGGPGRWVVGGHSLGGPAAARFAVRHSDQVRGYLLYGSYPDIDMRGLDSLTATSIYGTRDELSTAREVLGAPLPRSTEFVPIEGGVHSFFGDYGVQSGDGHPTIGRYDAQRQIIEAGLRHVRRVDVGARG